jgi:hypothetical protein
MAAKYYVIEIGQGLRLGVNRRLPELGMVSLGQLSATCYLSTKTRKKLPLSQYLRALENQGGRFLFARTNDNGNPSLTLNDEEARLEFDLPSGMHLDVTFKLRDMVFEGDLDLKND